MGFWTNTLSNFLSSLCAGIFIVLFYVMIQWFLAATDIVIGYNWKFDGTKEHPTNMRPSFDIRNRSKARVYTLANIAYTRDGTMLEIDNTSIWGHELKPGTISFFNEVQPLKRVNDLHDCLGLRVEVRLQSGRKLWLVGQGPGQLRPGRWQKRLLKVRDWMDGKAIPME